jgi:ubiquinone/menaquinone biosynthesis C-methylase UbiE
MMTEYDRLSKIYDYEWKDLNKDIDFIVELTGNYGSPILELASGTGRVLIPIVKKGLKVVGIDNSEEMLKICQKKVSELPKYLSSNVELIYGDMKNFSLKHKFKFIFVSFNSFLLLVSKKDQESCLQCVYNHLNDDGIFMVDIFSPNFKLCAEEKSEIRFLRHFHYPPENKVILQWEYVERNMAEQIMSIDFLYEEYDKNGNLNRYARHLTMAIIFRYEMQMMLEKNGLKVLEFYGNYDKSNFTNKSPQMIYICKKSI